MTDDLLDNYCEDHLDEFVTEMGLSANAMYERAIRHDLKHFLRNAEVKSLLFEIKKLAENGKYGEFFNISPDIGNIMDVYSYIWEWLGYDVTKCGNSFYIEWGKKDE